MIGRILFCLAVGYLCGCFSTGYLVGKLFHHDIRKEGSGNVGSTNALRTMGIKGGLLTFLGDAFKAVIPVLLVRFYGQDWTPCWEVFALYMGIGVVLGHNFPFWLKFSGGKGIAATGGVILSIADWRITLAGLAVFIIIVAVTRYVSLGSLIVAWYLPLNTLLFYRGNENFLHIMVLCLVFTAFAYLRHMENIKRLLQGNERKLGQKHLDS